MASAIAPCADELWKWLRRSGIALTDDVMIQRVVIDVPLSGAVKLYIERFADERLLNVEPPDLSECTVEWGKPTIEEKVANEFE